MPAKNSSRHAESTGTKPVVHQPTPNVPSSEPVAARPRHPNNVYVQAARRVLANYEKQLENNDRPDMRPAVTAGIEIAKVAIDRLAVATDRSDALKILETARADVAGNPTSVFAPRKDGTRVSNAELDSGVGVVGVIQEEIGRLAPDAV